MPQDSTEVLKDNLGWITGPPLPIPLFSHCLSSIDNENDTTFMIHGGRSTNWSGSKKVWLFDWANQEWTSLPDLGVPISDHACAPITLADGSKVIVTAGGESQGNPLKVDFINVDKAQLAHYL